MFLSAIDEVYCSIIFIAENKFVYISQFSLPSISPPPTRLTVKQQIKSITMFKTEHASAYMNMIFGNN